MGIILSPLAIGASLGIGLIAAPIGIGISVWNASKKEDQFKAAIACVKHAIC